MSHAVYVEATPDTATAIHCEQCEGADDGQCFYDGWRAIEEHAHSLPLHTRITWLRREVV